VITAGVDVKDRVSDVDFLAASMALRQAPILSRLASTGTATPAFPAAAAAYGLLAAGADKSIYSLYSSLLRLQPTAIGINPAALAAAAMVRPPTMTVFPSPPIATTQLPTTPVNTTTAKTTPDTAGSGSSCGSETKSSRGGGGGGIVPSNSALLNGGHRYRPYMPSSSIATVAKRLDTPVVRQSN